MPDSDVLGGVGDGWRVAMSTAGNERGLSLRSPGRFCAAADRLVELYRSRPDAARRRRRRRRLDQGAGLPLLHLGHGHPAGDGGDMGAAGSVNKVFWSELDIALHETALDLLGPEAELESRWLDGYTFSLSGPIYAGTNEVQRNIVAERILGLPREPKGRGPMRFELTEDQRDFAAVPRPAAGRRRHRRGGAGLGRRRPRARPQALGPAGRAGRHDARHRGDARSSSCIAFEALGRHAVPGPVGRVGGLPAGGPGPRGRADRHGRRTAARAARARRRRRRRGLRRRARSSPTSARCARSVDRTRRLFEVTGAERGRAWDEAFDAAVLAVSAQLLGAGERVLADSVAYVKQRKQFGREIGSYQAIKHALADVRIALDFARPLVFGAALGEISPSAAKVAAGDAAYLAVPHRACRCTARSATPPSST